MFLVKKENIATLTELTPQQAKSLLRDSTNNTFEEKYKPLKQRMLKNGFDKNAPIIVDDEMMVCDGHHRLTVALELNLNVWIIVDRPLPDFYENRIS